MAQDAKNLAQITETVRGAINRLYSTRPVGKRRIRYVVRDKTGRKVKETDSRIVAWFTWFARRSEGATAHDRFSWIEDEKSWLRCRDLPPDQRRD